MPYERIEIEKSEIERQIALCRKLKERFISQGRKNMLAFVDTYGCQQNESDSERLRGYLAEMGCAFTSDEAEADIIVINTCAVREHAEMRILGNVGALNHTKKAKPEQMICICGCMVQQQHMSDKVKHSYPIVSLCFGPHELWRFPELLERYLVKKKRVFATAPHEGCVTEGEPRVRDRGVKAWISIMYGCNNFCSYCIVPYVRGRERSRRPEAIVEEARELIAAGYKDITLLGQNVNSYGKDLECGVDFSELLKMVNAIPGKFVIRFMTSHPKDATEKLFRTMAECEKCSHHIHLPVQSGNDRVLKAMNRGYTSADYLEKVRIAREYMSDLVITTDMIVGFPGETNEEFEDTLRLVEAVGYDSMFTFIYSRREGTVAAKLPDPMTRQEKQVNFDKLLETANALSLEKHREYVGKSVEVLIDGYTAGEEYPITSRTKGGRLVHMKGDASLVGEFRKVKITDSTTWALFGELEE